MATAWTPGPWTVTKDGRVFSASRKEWNRTLNREMPEFVAACSENLANARLIAQAPAMAEALREFYNAYKDHPERLGTSSAAADHLECARAILRAVEESKP